MIILKIYATAKPKGDFLAAIFCVLLSFLIIAVTVLCTPKIVNTTASLKESTPVVIVDAGHGGIDGGAVAPDGTQEKDINLKIAKNLCNILTLSGIKVIPVRTEDISIHDESAKTIRQKKISDIHNRLALTEQTPNCILVSIHQNIYQSSSAKGTQVFYSRNAQNSAVLAKYIQNSVVSLLQPDNHRMTKEAGSDIYLLYQTKVPAVMVECGFLSNPADLSELKTEKYQSRIAFAVYSGITQYINSSEG